MPSPHSRIESETSSLELEENTQQTDGESEKGETVGIATSQDTRPGNAGANQAEKVVNPIRWAPKAENKKGVKP